MSNTDSSKPCRECGPVVGPKPLSEFSRDPKSKDGRRNLCRSCAAAHNRSYREANAARISEQQSRYREANADVISARKRRYNEANKSKVAARKRRYRQANAQRQATWAREWRERNAEHAAEYNRRWAEANRAKRRANDARRRAAKRGADGVLTAENILQMLVDQGGLCAYCEAPLEGTFHADHMIPLSRGGTHDWSNVAITCPTCNVTKHAKTAEEFMALAL